jgi:hypothetical protein
VCGPVLLQGPAPLPALGARCTRRWGVGSGSCAPPRHKAVVFCDGFFVPLTRPVASRQSAHMSRPKQHLAWGTRKLAAVIGPHSFAGA